MLFYWLGLRLLILETQVYNPDAIPWFSSDLKVKHCKYASQREKKKGSLNVKNSSNTNLGRHNDWLVLEDTYTNLTICIHFYWAEHGSKNLRSFAVQVEQEKPPDIITP